MNDARRSFSDNDAAPLDAAPFELNIDVIGFAAFLTEFIGKLIKLFIFLTESFIRDEFISIFTYYKISRLDIL